MNSQNPLGRLTAFAESPYGLAFMNTLGYTEGADYDTIQGYVGRVKDWKDHPRQMGPLSDAAGKGQFLSTTWEETKRALGLPDFSPRSQRIAAAYLADRRLSRAGLGGIEAIQEQGITPEIAAALAPEWASFPTKSGKSYYGQPVKKLSEIQQVYEKNLRGGTTGNVTERTRGTQSTDDMSASLLKQIFGGGGGFNQPELEVPGLGTIGKASGGMRFANIAAPLIAALPMLSAQDPVAGQLLSQKLSTDMANQALIGAHRAIASAGMPEAPQLPNLTGSADQAAMGTEAPANSMPSQQVSQGRPPGIQKTAYGDRVEFETPDGTRYRLIHGTKDLKSGTYVQGGWGPQGPNQYGDHFDIARTDGGYFDRSVLDKFALVDGKPLSAGLTVEGGKFGASRDGGQRVHRAWDFAFGKGARLQLANGARWLL